MEIESPDIKEPMPRQEYGSRNSRKIAHFMKENRMVYTIQTRRKTSFSSTRRKRDFPTKRYWKYGLRSIIDFGNEWVDSLGCGMVVPGSFDRMNSTCELVGILVFQKSPVPHRLIEDHFPSEEQVCREKRFRCARH